MILIFGHQDDILVCKTYESLLKQGAEVIFIEGSNFLKNIGVNYSLAHPNSNCFLIVNSHKVELKNISSVLVRLRQAFGIDPDMNQEDQMYTINELNATLKGLLNLLGWRVINSQSLKKFDNSALIVNAEVESVITECGFKLPKRLVTSNYESGVQFYKSCNQRAILSSLSKWIPWGLIEGQEGFSHIQTLLAKHPICLQEAPFGHWLRVFTVSDRVFGSYLPVEFSTDSTRQLSLQATEIFPALSKRCSKLAQTLHLDLAQFDLLQTNQDESYCFAIRNFPIYEQCNEQLRKQMTDALAELLNKFTRRYEEICV